LGGKLSTAEVACRPLLVAILGTRADIRGGVLAYYALAFIDGLEQREAFLGFCMGLAKVKSWHTTTIRQSRET